MDTELATVEANGPRRNFKQLYVNSEAYLFNYWQIGDSKLWTTAEPLSPVTDHKHHDNLNWKEGKVRLTCDEINEAARMLYNDINLTPPLRNIQQTSQSELECHQSSSFLSSGTS
ncbi:hypothetical protein J6590_026178 [Homalodisca vitripennis]|nr:hypothetical protein J6590_026178 [Homalodisca vitripennis]